MTVQQHPGPSAPHPLLAVRICSFFVYLFQGDGQGFAQDLRFSFFVAQMSGRRLQASGAVLEANELSDGSSVDHWASVSPACPGWMQDKWACLPVFSRSDPTHPQVRIYVFKFLKKNSRLNIFGRRNYFQRCNIMKS